METVSRHTDHRSVLSEEGADLHAVMDRTPQGRGTKTALERMTLKAAQR